MRLRPPGPWVRLPVAHEKMLADVFAVQASWNTQASRSHVRWLVDTRSLPYACAVLISAADDHVQQVKRMDGARASGASALFSGLNSGPVRVKTRTPANTVAITRIDQRRLPQSPSYGTAPAPASVYKICLRAARSRFTLHKACGVVDGPRILYRCTKLS